MSKAKPWYHKNAPRWDGKVAPEAVVVEKKHPSSKKEVALTYYVRQPKQVLLKVFNPTRWRNTYRRVEDGMEVVKHKRKFKNRKAALQAFEVIKNDYNKETGWRKECTLINYKIEEI